MSTDAGQANADAFGTGEWGVAIEAASRLSFTLIDLNGESGRRNGMASLSLRRPALRATVHRGDRFSLVADANGMTHSEAIEEFLCALQEQWGTPPAEVRLDESLPAHNGFGSKTTTLLALGKAYALLTGYQVTTGNLARVARRAGTSGASVNLIDRGGFLVDGGHANPADFADDPRKYLIPSRYAGAARPPPVLINLPFPPWPILVIVGRGLELSGEPELEWFHRTMPIPAAEARRTAHLVLMSLAPAVAEANYPAFCRALNCLTYEHHYKQEQIAVQSEEIKELFQRARSQPDIDAIGMSVTGPMCFAFTRRPAAACEWVESCRAQGLVREYFFSAAQNHSAVLYGVPG